MKGLFGGIAEKVKIAGKNFTEFAMEPQESQSHLEVENKSLREKLLNQETEIQQYTTLISSLQQKIKSLDLTLNSIKDTPKSQDSTQESNLINFKIVIGNEDSARALELLESAELKSQNLQSRIDSLQSNCLKLKEEKHILQDSLNFEKMTHESLNNKLAKANSDLAENSATLSSVQDTLLKTKKSSKMHIEKSFKLIKKSYSALGLSISQNTQIDSLGPEDLEEFLQIQMNSIVDCVTKLGNELSGKFGAQQIKSIEDVRPAVQRVIEESTRKVLESQEIATASERMMQNLQKENNDLIKKARDLTITLENLKKNFNVMQEESFEIKEKLADMEKVQSESEQIKAICKRISEESKEKQAKFEEESRKFEKTYKYVNDIEEQLAQLKGNLRSSSSLADEKEKIISNLKKEKDSLLTQLNDLKQFSNSELSSSKHYYESIIKKVSEENAHEKKSLIEKNSAQVNQLESLIKTLQKDSDELALARTKIREHDKGIQEIHKIMSDLQTRVNFLNEKNEKLNEEKEKIAIESSEKEKKLMSLVEEMKKNENESKISIQELKDREASAQERIKEADNLKEEANLLLSQVQEKMESQENWIDRRMVVTFLVNFLNENNTEKMKTQMLRPFAEMLGLDKEQRIKIGLEMEPGLLAQFTNFLTRG